MDHHARIARLHRDNDLKELLAHADTQKLHCRLDHTGRGVAKFVDNMASQRAVINTDTQGNATLTTLLDKGLKLAATCAIVARVDTHLIDRIGCDRGYLGYEMNVGNDGCRVAILAHLGHDIGQRLALALTLRCEAHNGCSGIGYALHLRHALRNIGSSGVCHRLHCNRVRAANHGRSNSYLATLSANIFCQLHNATLYLKRFYLIA